MIKFKKIRFKNLLSYGNTYTEYQLDSVKNTLIVGKTGSGKSTLLEAVFYVLFGKTYRDIRLPQLPNSINVKGMVVEIDFSIGSNEYKIIRGMKPTIFEIYKDSKLIDQEAAMRDYQGYLEKNILKINHKTFSQVVVIGSAAFTPFMQLPTGLRRNVIEDVLDISVFSVMNSTLKTKMSLTKTALESITVKLELAKRDVVSQQRVIKILTDAKNGRVQEEKNAIQELNSKLHDLEEEFKSHNETLESLVLSQPDKVDEKELSASSRIYYRYVDEQTKLIERIDKIKSLIDCPTCLQCVTDAHKLSVESDSKNTLDTILIELKSSKSDYDKLVAQKDKWKQIESELVSSRRDLSGITSSIEQVKKDISKREDLIISIQSNTVDVQSEKTKLKTIADEALVLLRMKNELLEEKEIQDVSFALLKDTGIKAAVVSEYIPIINKLINKYLEDFNFHISFSLDDNFNETLLSRGRDTFSYSSFSAGEQCRIDLAILFAFRQISEMKNSANCNLLILDEIGSQVFDEESVDFFMEILSNFKDGNNFVISHNPLQYEIFDSVFRVIKTADFSEQEKIL